MNTDLGEWLLSLGRQGRYAQLMRKLLAVMAMMGLASLAAAQKPLAPAPDEYKVKFETSKGEFVVAVTRAWAPHGADRFHELVRRGFYDDCRFFRVVAKFVVQFGINGDPQVHAQWKRTIPDDRVKERNRAGTVSFASRGPGTRTTQVFINLADNGQLDSMGFAAFGKVIEGMEVVQALYAGYGESPPKGRGPAQSRIEAEGNYYLKNEFFRMDYIKKAAILP